MTEELKRMQQRGGTAAAWTTANPVLLAGEIGFETDTNKFKIGDGASVWTALAYKSAQGAQGPQGAQGAQGNPGTNGTDGKTIISGTAAPSDSVGTNGDYFFDSVHDMFYGPKSGGHWPMGFSIIGPEGPPGPTALAIGGDATGSVGSGGPTLTLAINTVGGATAANVATATAAVLAATTAATANTLALRDNAGSLTALAMQATAPNNEFCWVNRIGTAFQMGFTTYQGFALTMVSSTPFCQFSDNLGAYQDVSIVGRLGRHLTLGADGSSAARGVRVVASPVQTYDLLQLCDPNYTVLSHFDINGQLMLGAGTPTDTISVNGTASKTGGGAWATFSDARLKDVQGEYHRGLDEVLRLRPIRYRYKADNALGADAGVEHVGLIAQELQKILPEAVKSKAVKRACKQLPARHWPELSADDHEGIAKQTEEKAQYGQAREAFAKSQHCEHVDLLSIEPDHIQWALVNALQALSAKIDRLESALAAKK